MSKNIICLGEDRFSKQWLKTVTENLAVRAMPSIDPDRVRKAWKMANGFTIPNYTKEEKQDKPKRKRSPNKKKKEDA